MDFKGYIVLKARDRVEFVSDIRFECCNYVEFTDKDNEIIDFNWMSAGVVEEYIEDGYLMFKIEFSDFNDEDFLLDNVNIKLIEELTAWDISQLQLSTLNYRVSVVGEDNMVSQLPLILDVVEFKLDHYVISEEILENFNNNQKPIVSKAKKVKIIDEKPVTFEVETLIENGNGLEQILTFNSLDELFSQIKEGLGYDGGGASDEAIINVYSRKSGGNSGFITIIDEDIRLHYGGDVY